MIQLMIVVDFRLGTRRTITVIIYERDIFCLVDWKAKMAQFVTRCIFT